MRVAILGASNKPQRYSYMAQELLLEKGHIALPVHPVLKEINGIEVYASLDAVPPPVEVVTLYIGAPRQDGLAELIIRLRPARVIFNPGTENPALLERLREAGIDAVEACTLVLLKTTGLMS